MTKKRNHFKFKDGKPVGAVIYARDIMTEKRLYSDETIVVEENLRSCFQGLKKRKNYLQ